MNKVNKNKIVCLIIGLLCIGSLHAQSQSPRVVIEQDETGDKFSVLTRRFFYNWFIGAGGGGQIYFGKNDSEYSFSKRLTPTFNMYLGKWFTPGMGLRIGIEGAQANGLTLNNGSWYEQYYNTGETYEGYFIQKIKYSNVTGEVMFNLTNLFCGYNPDRVYNIIPHTGIGLVRSENKSDSHEHELAVTAGILNTFRLSNTLALTLDVKGNLFNGSFSHKEDIDVNKPGHRDYIASASIGLVYKFKQRDWSRGGGKVTHIYNEDELNNLRRQLEEAKNKKPEIVEVEKVIEVVKETDDVVCKMINNITFAFNSADITAESQDILDEIAAYMKRNSHKRYLITGYADARGSDEYNLDLSVRRAKAIVRALIERGVSSDIIKSRGVGKRIAYASPSLSDEERSGDRKITVEVITNTKYWNLLPSGN